MATDISTLLREAETHSADTPEFQDRSDAAACMFPIAPGSRLEYLEAVRLGHPPIAARPDSTVAILVVRRPSWCALAPKMAMLAPRRVSRRAAWRERSKVHEWRRFRS